MELTEAPVAFAIEESWFADCMLFGFDPDGLRAFNYASYWPGLVNNSRVSGFLLHVQEK